MDKCEAHTRHSPKALTVEWHHVVPRAWQRFWTPEGAHIENNSTYGPMWDPRGVFLCPTGHRNVHYMIVKLMHGQTINSSPEQRIAQEALDRYKQVGGLLETLQKNKLWGQA